MPSFIPHGILTPGLGITIATPPLALAATGNKTMFTVYGGPIHVNGLFGVVTTAIQNQACTVQLSVQIAGLSAVTITSNATSVANLAVGTLLAPITSFATALNVSATNGVIINGPGFTGSLTQFEIGMASGSTNTATIFMTTSATNTGAVQWYLNYTPYNNSTPVVGTQANYPTAQAKAAIS